MPWFIVPVLQNLMNAAQELQHKVLEWETVLTVVKKTVGEEMTGYQVFVVASFCDTLGMVRCLKIYLDCYHYLCPVYII